MLDFESEVTRGVPSNIPVQLDGCLFRACRRHIKRQDALRRASETPALPVSASDEVDYLEMIAFGKLGFAPLFARDNIAVQFYGYPILLHAELFD